MTEFFIPMKIPTVAAQMHKRQAYTRYPAPRGAGDAGEDDG